MDFTYDELGRLVEEAADYDPALADAGLGALEDFVRQFVYDLVGNRLEAATLAPAGDTTSSYQYNARDQLLSVSQTSVSG